MAGECECGNKTSGSIKRRFFCLADELSATHTEIFSNELFTSFQFSYA